MSFGNMGNWEGFTSNEICSQDIYDFPSGMEPSVISIPSNFTLATKEIILPRNGHLVFQNGSIVFSNLPNETCQGKELKFRRIGRGDWFDPNNWNGNDSLLNFEAIPHVERVPCQYDSVQFPSERSFHLFISLDVVVRKFFLGEEELNFTQVASLMSSELGKIQFTKNSNIQLRLDGPNWEDNDDFICNTYDSPTLRQKICSFQTCGIGNLDENCQNPITPHGFCCPICGYHLKIRHNGDFRLKPVKTKLESLSGGGRLGVFVGRYARKFAHIVFIPWMNKTTNVGKLIDEIRSFLAPDSSVTEVTLSKSWEDSESGHLTAGGSSAGITTIIVLLVLLILTGLGFLIFFWTKRNGYPPITWNSIVSRIPAMPGFNTPRPSFSFARFTNERISSINLGATVSGDIQRTEKVDTDADPIEMRGPPESGGTDGYTNATYDLCDIGPPDATRGSVFPSTLDSQEHVYDLVEVDHDSSAILQFDSSRSEE